MRRGTPIVSTPDPRTICGSSLAQWVRGDYVSASSSGTTDSMLDRTSSATVSQATSGKKPIALLSNGRPVVRFDGVDDVLECVLGSSISSRSWCWLVAKIVTLPTGTPNWIGATTSDGASQYHLIPLRVTATNFSGIVSSTDGNDVISGPARDTNAHLFECGYETSGTGRFVVDGVSYDGVFSGGPGSTGLGAQSTAKVTLGAFIGPAAWLNVDVFEFGLCNALPTTDQRLALRAYVARRYGVGTVRFSLDALQAPLAAYSSAFRVLTSAQSAYQVRRASDNATLDIGFKDNKVDTASLLSFCAGTSGFVVTLYDQTSAAKHLTAPSTGEQPRVVNGGVLDTTANGTPTMVFSGAQTLKRSDALGLTGSPALTVGYCGASTVNSKIMFILGKDPASAVNDTMFGHNTGSSSTVPLITQNGSFRGFTASAQSSQHYYIAGKAASATPSAFTLEQDGAALSQASVSNGSNAMSMTNELTIMGNNNTAPSGYLTGNMNCMFVFNAVLAGANLSTLRTALGAHL